MRPLAFFLFLSIAAAQALSAGCSSQGGVVGDGGSAGDRGTGGEAGAGGVDRTVVATVSTEYYPMDARWFSDPWDAGEIPNRWSPVSTLTPISGDPVGPVIQVDPARRHQQILGLGTSFEHTTVYALQKNKDRSQQKDVLRALIDRDQGLGLNLFRLTIGTSDFADGTRAVPPPADPSGWYTLQDTPEAPFSIERDRSLGIVEVARLAVEVAAEAGTEIRFFASAWSPPSWMREGGKLIQGGPLKADMLDDYAAYLRAFIEAYQAEGIPIYAITMQNERQFEPATYPGMIISWEMERDLLIEVYENFHNISGDYGDVLDVKLWTLDHNFDLWEQAREQISSLKSLGKADYLDATAFHHYGGDPEAMRELHQAHPDKDIIFTEGTVWGLNADNNRRGYETLLRHFRNWSTGYVSWVTMSTQTLDEANQGPYNQLGRLDPTLLVKTDGDNPDWYKTPEFWLLGQFSKYIHSGAVRIASDYGSLDTVTTVAFENTDGKIVLIVANSTDVEQPFSVSSGETSFSSAIAPKSVATYRW